VNAIDVRSLYDSLMPMLFRVAVRIVQSPETAEDIVHEAFAKLVEKNIPFPSPDDAKYWLIRVVKNSAINHSKRKVRENRAYEKWWKGETALDVESRTRSAQADADGVFIGVSEGADAQLLKEESARELRAALADLPERLRTVLVLKEYGGLNYKEIGKVMGISEGNVKVRAFRAREQLLAILGEKK
jgi:RNA polymerase sigma-70 factor (ECF subfamily)